MRDGSIFPYRLVGAITDGVTRKGMRSGVLDVPVKARRARRRQIRGAHGPRRDDEANA